MTMVNCFNSCQSDTRLSNKDKKKLKLKNGLIKIKKRAKANDLDFVGSVGGRGIEILGVVGELYL